MFGKMEPRFRGLPTHEMRQAEASVRPASLASPYQIPHGLRWDTWLQRKRTKGRFFWGVKNLRALPKKSCRQDQKFFALCKNRNSWRGSDERSAKEARLGHCSLCSLVEIGRASCRERV